MPCTLYSTSPFKHGCSLGSLAKHGCSLALAKGLLPERHCLRAGLPHAPTSHPHPAPCWHLACQSEQPELLKMSMPAFWHNAELRNE